MSEAPKNLLEFLEQLRAERNELNILIAGLEKRLGIAPAPTENEETSRPRVTVSVDSIPVGFFHNLSQPAATEKLLRLNPGHPLETTEILEAFRKAGMQITSKNAPTILYTTLKRNPKFERVAGKAWGLAEWYPEKKQRKKDQEETIENKTDDILS
jgi:hypothetical protein